MESARLTWSAIALCKFICGDFRMIFQASPQIERSILPNRPNRWHNAVSPPKSAFAPSPAPSPLTVRNQAAVLRTVQLFSALAEIKNNREPQAEQHSRFLPPPVINAPSLHHSPSPCRHTILSSTLSYFFDKNKRSLFSVAFLCCSVAFAFLYFFSLLL